MSTNRLAALTPLLVYVNVPFCNSKCHFCDWVVQVPIGDLRLGPETQGRRDHLTALQDQIAVQAPVLSEHYGPRIMYWGGGTASILSCAEIETLHRALAGGLELGGLVETTIEGSPESLTPEKLRLLRGLGFDRISIGVQSFDDDRLRMIGRVHSADVAERSVGMARDAGFDNVNIDLIVGFPDQPPAEVERTARRAAAIPVNHYSVYPYRASPGTVMRRRLNRADSRTDLARQLDAYRRTGEILAEHGSPEYAMSYFGDPPCRADDAYYRLTMDWIGFGSGANSLVGGRYLAFERGKLQHYIARPGDFDANLPAATPSLTLHFLSQALTTPEGMDARTFQERTGTPLRRACEEPEVRAYLDRMSRHGRVIADATGIRIHRDDIAQIYVALNWIDVVGGPVPVDIDAYAPIG